MRVNKSAVLDTNYHIFWYKSKFLGTKIINHSKSSPLIELKMLFSIFCVRNFLLLVLLFVQKRAAQENTLQAMVLEDSTVAEINVTNLINVARYFFEVIL